MFGKTKTFQDIINKPLPEPIERNYTEKRNTESFHYYSSTFSIPTNNIILADGTYLYVKITNEIEEALTHLKKNNKLNNDVSEDNIYRIKYISTTLDKRVIERKEIKDIKSIRELNVQFSKIYNGKFCIFIRDLYIYNSFCDNCSNYKEGTNKCDECGCRICNKCHLNNKNKSNDVYYDIYLCDKCFDKRLKPKNYKCECPICKDRKILMKNSKMCSNCSNAICQTCYIYMLEDMIKDDENKIKCPHCRKSLFSK